MAEQPQIRTLDELLEASRATPEFQDAVRALARGENQDRIDFNWGSPPVKVLRLITKMLEMLPREPIEKVRIKGVSGCSTFTGVATLEPGDLAIDFEWDCRWRAEQEDWRDCFGDPDQMRAAHEYGYQCFRTFNVQHAATGPATPARPTAKPTR